MKLRLFTLPLAAALALAATGCDSGSDPKASDRDAFIGTHRVVKIEDNVQTTTPRDLTAQVINAQGVEAIELTFRENGTYRLFVNYQTVVNNAPPAQGGRPDVTIDGAVNSAYTFTVNETAKTATLNVPLGAGTVPASLAYTIESDTRLSVTTAAALFNQVFGTTIYQGNVRLTVQKQ